MGPVRAERGWGGVGHAMGFKAEWGWGGVGPALGSNSITLRLGPGYKDRPSGAAWGRADWGRV